MMMFIYIKQHLRNIWIQFVKKLSNIEAELKKRFAYKKKGVYHHFLKVTTTKKNNFRKYSLNWRFFYFMEKLCSVLKIFNVFVSLIIPSTVVSDAMTSICTWKRVLFVTYLFYHKPLGHEIWPTSRYSDG